MLDLYKRYCPDKTPNNLSHKISSGVDGEVYEIIDDITKVIKLCVMHPFEADYTQVSKVLDYLILYPSNTYARVYAHEYAGEFIYPFNQKLILFNYTMEKLNNLSSDEAKIFHTILSHEDRNIKKNYSIYEVEKMLKSLSRGLDFDEKKIIIFYSNFKKTPISHNDLHPRNIMKDNSGNFKLVDFDRCTLTKGE